MSTAAARMLPAPMAAPAPQPAALAALLRPHRRQPRAGFRRWAGPLLLLAFTRQGARWPVLAMGALAMVCAQAIGWRGVLPLPADAYLATTAGCWARPLPALSRSTGWPGQLDVGRLLFLAPGSVAEYLVTRAGQEEAGARSPMLISISPALLQLAAVTGLSASRS